MLGIALLVLPADYLIFKGLNVGLSSRSLVLLLLDILVRGPFLPLVLLLLIGLQSGRRGRGTLKVALDDLEQPDDTLGLSNLATILPTKCLWCEICNRVAITISTRGMIGNPPLLQKIGGLIIEVLQHYNGLPDSLCPSIGINDRVIVGFLLFLTYIGHLFQSLVQISDIFVQLFNGCLQLLDLDMISLERGCKALQLSFLRVPPRHSCGHLCVTESL
mmetsp:Transcript_137578/g.343314  ORF Transcript_137578/g.343314 Transcript_137578/m.343314 type:complete len:218 (-) Transcript_137578:1419-2072(-)